ncbi:MAG: ComEC/Rec2 family competence protein [Candidatus Saccharimonadales bacterium]
MYAQLWRREVHRSWGLCSLSVGLIIGLATSRAITFHPGTETIVIALAVLVLILLIRVKIATLVVIVALATIIGIIRGNFVHDQLTRTASLTGQIKQINGIIAEDPQISVRGDLRIIMSNLVIDAVSYKGSLWTSGAKGEYKRGDTIVVEGTLSDGFATHQLSMYRPKISSVMRQNDPVISFRDSFAAAVRRGVIEPAASLGIGFVIGQKSALPPELEEQLRIVGLTHLVVASGYNLTILIRFAKRLFEKYSRFLVNASSISMITGFVMISGASPSMVRASLVSGLSLIVWNYGRTIHPVFLIIFVAAATATYQPNYLWVDLGWWLSFLAFFGVLVISPLSITFVMKFKKMHKEKPSSIMQLVSETIAAQIMTLPIVLYTFGLLPVTALIANMITAPIIPLAMAVTAVAGLGSMVLPGLAGIIALPATILLSYFVAIVRTLSRFPWAIQEFTIPLPVMVGIYLGIVALVGAVWYILRYNFRQQSIID